jgi:hypothetical protein
MKTAAEDILSAAVLCSPESIFNQLGRKAKSKGRGSL